MLDTYNQYIRSVDLKTIDTPNEFPFHLPILRNFTETFFHPNVTFFVGENGSGKSTLLEAISIALGFNPEGGTKNFQFSSYDSHSSLDDYLRISKGVKREKRGFFFRAETFYNVASYIEELDPSLFDSFGGKSLHEQSHGEAFFSTFLNKFQANGLYILDEPESALSPIKQLSMLARIHELVNEDCQFIISTHSPILMSYPHAKIFELTERGLVETTVESTEHYQIMKQFFTDKDRVLYHLLKETVQKDEN